MQPNTMSRIYDETPEIPVIVGLAVSTFIIIILNAEEVYEKVLLCMSVDKVTCDNLQYLTFLYVQIALSALIMYFSVLLMMKQKTPLDQLMNLTALWTLNNFDNFFYLILNLILMKNSEHRKIIKSDNYMKFRVKENSIDATVWWVYI